MITADVIYELAEVMKQLECCREGQTGKIILHCHRIAHYMKQGDQFVLTCNIYKGESEDTIKAKSAILDQTIRTLIACDEEIQEREVHDLEMRRDRLIEKLLL